jgi:bisphosphoglycerate-dependent phosphoglycerate mutase
MMDKVVTVIRLLILLLCAVLFLAGALWNLCLQPEKDIESMDVHNMVYAENSQETVDVFFKQEVTVEDTAIQDQQIIENRLAALRMERDAAWQQLYRAVEVLEFAEKQQTLRQYAEMQYNEQRLELLLKAKGIEHSLVILGEKQANIIASTETLQQESEKLFDIVLRNTEYDETQIILVPLK